MNKNKGFILSLTSLYYVVIFIIFVFVLGLSVYVSFASDSQENLEIINQSEFITNVDGTLISTGEFWCQEYIYYSTERSNTNYNNLDDKKYCGGYDSKRFI